MTEGESRCPFKRMLWQIIILECGGWDGAICSPGYVRLDRRAWSGMFTVHKQHKLNKSFSGEVTD
jgi:hypothetical protein